MKRMFNRLLSVVIVVAVMFGCFSPLTAKAASSYVRLHVAYYNDDIILKEGQQVTQSLINEISAKIYAEKADGSRELADYKVAEKGNFVHANKNNKFTITYCFAGLKVKLSFRVMKATKLTVKATGKSFYEGQILTEKDIQKTLYASVTYSNGKKVRNFKGYTCKQLGKKVKSNKNGQYRLDVKIGKISKKIYVNVIGIKRIYVQKCTMQPIQGSSFKSSEMKSKAIVKAVYTNGKTKTLKTYSVSPASKKVKANSKGEFAVTIKYSKLSCKISLPVLFKVTVEKLGEGTVKVAGKTVAAGESITTKKGNVTFVANPSSGYKFDGWRVGGKIVSTSSTYKRSIKSNETVTAVFTKKETPVTKVTATVSVEGAGTATVNGQKSVTVDAGTEVTLDANPSSGYKFDGWRVGGKIVSTSNPGKRSITSNETITAVFTKIPVTKVTATVSVEGAGTATVNGQKSVTVDAGTEVTFVANPSSGYKFDGWRVGGKIVSTSNPGKRSITSNETITAVFTKIEHTLTLKNNSSSTIKVNGSVINFVGGVATVTLEEGATVSLSIIDSDDVRFVRWANEKTGEELSTSRTYTFTMDSEKTVVAVSEKAYKLKVSLVNGKAKVMLSGNEMSFYGGVAEEKLSAGTYELEVLPTDDYDFIDWSDSNTGKSLGTARKLQITVANNKGITVNLAEAEKTVVVAYWHEGDETPIASKAVEFGGTFAPPTEGIWRADRTFAGWKLNNVLYEGKYTDSEFKAKDGTKLSDAIIALTTAKKPVNIYSHYVPNPVETFTVTLTKGTFNQGLDADGNDVTGKTSATFTKNTLVYVITDEKEGDNFFVEWQDANGKTKSYDRTYGFLVSSNIQLSPVYAAEVPAPKPLVTLDSYVVYPENYGISYKMSCNIPETYKKVEWGILVSTSYDQPGLSGEAITYDSGAFVMQETLYPHDLIVSNGGYDLELGEPYFREHDVVEVRAYAIVTSTTGGTEYIYSANTIRVEL